MTQPSQDRPDLALPPQPPVQGGTSRRDPADAPPVPADLAHADSAQTLQDPSTMPPDSTPPASSRQPYTRIRAAWVGVWAGVLAVILLIIFVGQNTAPVNIQFLWLDGQIPTALALLVAGVGGAVIAMAIAAARILQLRRAIRHQ